MGAPPLDVAIVAPLFLGVVACLIVTGIWGNKIESTSYQCDKEKYRRAIRALWTTIITGVRHD